MYVCTCNRITMLHTRNEHNVVSRPQQKRGSAHRALPQTTPASHRHLPQQPSPETAALPHGNLQNLSQGFISSSSDSQFKEWQTLKRSETLPASHEGKRLPSPRDCQSNGIRGSHFLLLLRTSPCTPSDFFPLEAWRREAHSKWDPGRKEAAERHLPPARQPCRQHVLTAQNSWCQTWEVCSTSKWCNCPTHEAFSQMRQIFAIFLLHPLAYLYLLLNIKWRLFFSFSNVAVQPDACLHVSRIWKKP